MQAPPEWKFNTSTASRTSLREIGQVRLTLIFNCWPSLRTCGHITSFNTHGLDAKMAGTLLSKGMRRVQNLELRTQFSSVMFWWNFEVCPACPNNIAFEKSTTEDEPKGPRLDDVCELRESHLALPPRINCYVQSSSNVHNQTASNELSVRCLHSSVNNSNRIVANRGHIVS